MATRRSAVQRVMVPSYGYIFTTDSVVSTHCVVIVSLALSQQHYISNLHRTVNKLAGLLREGGGLPSQTLYIFPTRPATLPLRNTSLSLSYRNKCHCFCPCFSLFQPTHRNLESSKSEECRSAQNLGTLNGAQHRVEQFHVPRKSNTNKRH